MFDVGFSELVVIALVALIVIGPERLPRVARTAGALLGRMQRYVHDVKSEVRREMELEDLKRFQAQITEQVQQVETTIHNELNAIESDIKPDTKPEDSTPLDAVADAAVPSAAAVSAPVPPVKS